MDFNLQAIRSDFRDFWKTAKGTVHYKLRGEDFFPDAVSNFSIQLEEGDYGDGYNFKCQTLNLRIAADGVEKRYSAEFILKVVPIDTNNNEIIEKIQGIKDNCIYVKPL